MGKCIDAEKLVAEIERRKKSIDECPFIEAELGASIKRDVKIKTFNELISLITSLQQEQPDEQPEYGYLSTEYVHGRKPRWSVGDVLAYYICTSNEEGEDILGKIVNVEFDEEDGWVYTFEDESTWDEQSLVEEGTYKKN